MRVAVLNDIHGNLPALEAVMAEVRRERVDRIVVGGDVLPGPMPRETFALLMNLDLPVHFLYGNGELAVLAQMTASDPAAVMYWGVSGAGPLPERFREPILWTARQLSSDYKPILASWPKTVTLEIDGLGEVLFCHATPRNETEIFFERTAEDRLVPVFAGVNASLVVCGHMHMQFDRMVGRTRVVNAGSVGMPFGPAGADWLVLGPDIQFRHTAYDLEHAADRIRATSYPQAREFAADNVLNPPSAAKMLEAFANAELIEEPHVGNTSNETADMRLAALSTVLARKNRSRLGKVATMTDSELDEQIYEMNILGNGMAMNDIPIDEEMGAFVTALYAEKRRRTQS